MEISCISSNYHIEINPRYIGLHLTSHHAIHCVVSSSVIASTVFVLRHCTLTVTCHFSRAMHLPNINSTTLSNMLYIILLFTVCVLLYTLCFCSDAGVHDRVVIQELLKEAAQSRNLESVQKDFKGMTSLICCLITSLLIRLLSYPYPSFTSSRLLLLLYTCIYLLSHLSLPLSSGCANRGGPTDKGCPTCTA